MKQTFLLAGILAGAAAAAFAQDSTTYQSQTTNNDGSQTTTTTTTKTTVTGSVVSYEPGRTIVLREPSNRVVTYRLGPTVTIPYDVKVGRTVTVYAEPGVGGETTVTRVTTNADGSTTRTTERTSTSGTEVWGTVDAYEPGRTVRIVGPSGTPTTYYLTDRSQLPPDIKVGKKVRVYTTTTMGPDGPVVERVVTYKVKKHHHHHHDEDDD